jgi:hypothetical protein
MTSKVLLPESLSCSAHLTPTPGLLRLPASAKNCQQNWVLLSPGCARSVPRKASGTLLAPDLENGLSAPPLAHNTPTLFLLGVRGVVE